MTGWPLAPMFPRAIWINPFPTLIISDMIRIFCASLIVPVALSDRSPATVGRVWMYMMGHHRLGPSARRRARPPRLPGAPRSTVGDVPTAYGASRHRETGTGGRSTAMGTMSRRWIVMMIL